jgi:hypothetical protein
VHKTTPFQVKSTWRAPILNRDSDNAPRRMRRVGADGFSDGAKKQVPPVVDVRLPLIGKVPVNGNL